MVVLLRKLLEQQQVLLELQAKVLLAVLVQLITQLIVPQVVVVEQVQLAATEMLQVLLSLVQVAQA